jgi:predicted PurR-regulated permease PerM
VADPPGEAGDDAEREPAHAEAEDLPDGGAPPHDPLLDTAVRRLEARVDEENPYGRPGKPLSRRSPFHVGFTAALGVGVAYVLARAVVATSQVLVLILVAAFLAVGLDPVVTWLGKHGMRRSLAVLLVLLATFGVFGGFVAAVAPPITRQATQLVDKAPGYLEDLQKNNSTFRHLDNRYHIVAEIKKRVAEGPTLGLKALGGVLGIGKAIIGFAFSALTVIILMTYFLANLPSIKRFVYRLVPRTRRARVGLITDEILARVGGYVLGNLATSLVAGVTTFVFLVIAGVPYPTALGMFVAVTDLIPLVGATIGAIGVTLVALFVSWPVALITLAFYIAYQQFENYILQPRVMQKAVDVAPVVTIIAALLGAAILGILGALIAIPAAAAVQLVLSEVVYPRQDES